MHSGLLKKARHLANEMAGQWNACDAGGGVIAGIQFQIWLTGH